MKSSQKSRATVPQRLMLKGGGKVGRKSVVCHWKGFASGRRQNKLGKRDSERNWQGLKQKRD